MDTMTVYDIAAEDATAARLVALSAAGYGDNARKYLASRVVRTHVKRTRNGGRVYRVKVQRKRGGSAQ